MCCWCTCCACSCVCSASDPYCWPACVSFKVLAKCCAHFEACPIWFDFCRFFQIFPIFSQFFPKFIVFPFARSFSKLVSSQFRQCVVCDRQFSVFGTGNGIEIEIGRSFLVSLLQGKRIAHWRLSLASRAARCSSLHLFHRQSAARGRRSIVRRICVPISLDLQPPVAVGALKFLPRRDELISRSRETVCGQTNRQTNKRASG